jgi:uncharacterized repeat protein (TIGR01451 family)
VSNDAGVVTWTLSSLATNAFATNALVVQATITGTISNAATVTTGTADLNPDDDSASAVATIASPTADLAISLSDSPDPLLLGNYLTYTITVSNRGPATATGLVVVDALPPAVNFISASPVNSYTVVGQVVTFTNLGNLDRFARTNIIITVQPTTTGTITDTATCRSGILDPLKANNSASVKTIIVPTVPLSLSLAGNNLIIAWPISPWNFNLESATNLDAPTVWTPVTSPPPQINGGQNTVTVPIDGDREFFRLHQTP